jgi:UDP-N-acetylglucosamine:LPS N-acetylglucosamine transferase
MHTPIQRPPIAIVSAAMGGGHLQISRELKRRLTQWGHPVEVVDVLDLMPAATGRVLGDLYPLLVNRTPRLYQRIYEVFFQGRQRSGERAGIPVSLMVPRLRKLLQQMRPGLVLSTYPLAALAVGRVKETGDLACPAVTVITTFSVNNLWLHPAVDLELCISGDAAADATRRTGREAGVCGPIVRPGFSPAADETPVDRARTGAGHTAVVSTGSVGLAGSAVEAATLIAARPGWQVTVLCGRDEALRAQMSQVPNVQALGWVDDMPSVMAAADVLVDNAGGMTSKEALGLGLPIVTFRPIPGHGRDDAAALARLGLTDLVEQPEELMAALDRLTTDADYRAARIARGRALFIDEPLAPLHRLVGDWLERAAPSTG